MSFEKFHICKFFVPDCQIYVGNRGTIKRVTESGRVEILKQTTERGYPKVRINGKPYFVHRLVALVHVRKPKTNERLVIDHINGVKNDNRSVNLRWVTTDKNVNNPNTIGNLRNHGGRYVAINVATNKVKSVYKIGGFCQIGIKPQQAIKAAKNNTDLRNEIKTVRDVQGGEWAIYKVNRIFTPDGKEKWVSAELRKERRNQPKQEEPICVLTTARLRVPPPLRVAKRFEED